MSENFKIFCLSFLAVFSFMMFSNLLSARAEDFFLTREIVGDPPAFLLANVAEHFEPQVVESEQCEVSAQSAISVFIAKNKAEKIVFKKNIDEILPMASLAKMMTSIVIDEFYDPELIITISKKAVSQKENIGNLKTGERIKVKDLLVMALIESSNDAAYALAQQMSEPVFVEIMNKKAKELGLNNTLFFNPTGVDPDDLGLSDNFTNLSTARDLASLGKYLLNRPNMLAITRQKEVSVYLANGRFHHTPTNTNELLWEMDNIAGGKTGWTNYAGQCLVLITKGSGEDTYYINVVLNSKDRFNDIRKLINCL